MSKRRRSNEGAAAQDNTGGGGGVRSNRNSGNGATTVEAARPAAAAVAKTCIGQSAGRDSSGSPVVSNEAWAMLRYSLDFWDWILGRLSG